MNTLAKKKILISVVLPVYNCELYIEEAVLSILSQTISNFELIIVDDCSTDRTRSILDEITDARIVRINNSVNEGVVFSRNLAINAATGVYIALMDSDDISHPMRFEYQMNFLNKNTDIHIVGTSIKVINGLSSGRRRFIFPSQDSEIFAALHVMFPFANPSLMFRADALKKSYAYSSDALNYVEDYDLLARNIDNMKYANINTPLLFLRKHSTNYSSISESSHISSSVDISHKLIESRLNKSVQREVVDCIHSLGRRSPEYGEMAISTMVELYYAVKGSSRVTSTAKMSHFFGVRIFLTGLFTKNLIRSSIQALRIDAFFIFRLLARLIRRSYGVCEI